MSDSDREPEEFAAYDLRIRSIDREPDEPLHLCSECRDVTAIAYWSVWLHTPEWGPGDAGATRVVCTEHALALVASQAEMRDLRRTEGASHG